MQRHFIRIIDDQEVNVDGELSFTDTKGNRHPRSVLWLWSEEELWDVLHIRVDWIDEPSEILELDPIQIPKPVE